MAQIGRVGELTRYPIKSMAGVSTESAMLGWHGLVGDRRFAFRRVDEFGGFPWLSASNLPELLLYHPCGLDELASEPLPTHVITPAGLKVRLRTVELREEITERLGSRVEMMWFRNGIFDDGTVSVISMTTIAGIGREAGLELDRRRFRANIVVETENPEPFHEDEWVGQTLVFGEVDSGPAMSVTQRDLRCMMINLDPETAAQDGCVMKAAIRLNKNYAGVYATVVRCGAIRVGDQVSVIQNPTRK
jgi:uncharacterized protein YcbX